LRTPFVGYLQFRCYRRQCRRRLYSQQFENLLSIDCQKNPDDFYNQLLTTRESRKELNQKVNELTSTAEKYLSEINKIEIDGENIRFTPKKTDATKASSITNPANQVGGR